MIEREVERLARFLCEARGKVSDQLVAEGSQYIQTAAPGTTVASMPYDFRPMWTFWIPEAMACLKFIEQEGFKRVSEIS